MSIEKKSARPSAGTPRRATETGSASRADTTSNPQFTPNGRRGQWKISDLLSCGRENAISRRELEKLTSLDGRKVAPVLADNTTGYYLPAAEHERAACVRSMRHRAAEIMRTAEAIEGGRGFGERTME